MNFVTQNPEKNHPEAALRLAFWIIVFHLFLPLTPIRNASAVVIPSKAPCFLAKLY